MDVMYHTLDHGDVPLSGEIRSEYARHYTLNSIISHMCDNQSAPIIEELHSVDTVVQ